MKLQCNLKPRTDGTVIARDAKGKAYVFKREDGGALTCDVDDQALVARLLRGGYFEPVNAEDFAAADAMMGDDEDGEGDGQAEGGDGDVEVVGNGGPQEAGTPPIAAARPRKQRR